MAQSERKFLEREWEQGVDEIIAYQVDTSLWPGTGDPASVVVKLYQMPAYTDVSSTNLTGSNSVSGDIITTEFVTSLSEGVQYRLEVKWVKSGNTLEAYGFIRAKQ